MVFWYDVDMKKLVLFGDSLFAKAGFEHGRAEKHGVRCPVP
jgi:hypothetical protein